MLLLQLVSGCCSASGGFWWPWHWEYLNLLMLLQVVALSSFLEIFLDQDVAKVLVFPSEAPLVRGRIHR